MPPGDIPFKSLTYLIMVAQERHKEYTQEQTHTYTSSHAQAGTDASRQRRKQAKTQAETETSRHRHEQAQTQLGAGANRQAQGETDTSKYRRARNAKAAGGLADDDRRSVQNDYGIRTSKRTHTKARQRGADRKKLKT